MESLRSFVSFSGGELSKDTRLRKRKLEETRERATEEKSEVSQAASDHTQDDGAGNLFKVGLSIAYCINLEYIQYWLTLILM